MKKEVIRKTCVKCGHEFTYKEKFRSMYRMFWRMSCDNCGARYKVPVRYRFLYIFLLLLPLFIQDVLLIQKDLIPWLVSTTVVIDIPWVVCLYFLIPMFTRLQLDPEKGQPKEGFAEKQVDEPQIKSESAVEDK